jgi:two-component system cell cycle sensor histidine kinase/response regulator CckA
LDSDRGGSAVTEPIHVLLVEDSPTDAKLVIAELRKALAFEFLRVEDRDALRAALSQRKWDIVLSDWSMPKLTGLEALSIVRQSDPDISFILVSGTVGEHLAVDAMRAGARDYVLKDKLTRLAPAVERELRECEVRRTQRQLEARFRAIIECGTDGVILNREDGTIEYANPGSTAIFGLAPEELTGTRFVDYVHEGDRAGMLESMKRLRADANTIQAHECRIVRRDGSFRWVEGTGVNRLADPAIGAVVRTFRDVTDRKKASDDLRVSEARFARLAESGIVGITIADIHGNIREANDAYLKMLGYSRDELLSGAVRWTDVTPPERSALADRAGAQLRETGVAPAWETEHIRKDGSRVPVLVGVAMLDYPMCIAFTADLTERKRAERALHESEGQLRQAQKMEAVGRLAGGIAHDFNNVLSVILSYTEMLLGEMTPDDPIRCDVQEIRNAGKRAADLTRQLLMFSRQQILEPKILDLNDVLLGMDRMLKRILGADVDVVSVPGQALGRVRVDPSSIEQVIMNLVVNARDAMPTGGELTLETGNVVLGEEDARDHPDVKPGAFVRLAISDTGTGMDQATLSHIFEPFFTTKEKGKGTGLGLSTVFGIVQQSRGSVQVHSEIGKGTTFKVYLPRVDAPVVAGRSADPPQATKRGTETILLVEDDDQVRAVALSVLARSGYHVLEARNAGEALLLAESHAGAIHLLLADVVMPRLSGPELAKRLATSRPEMKVLCMSGYTDDSIARHGVLEAHFAFLQKPITPETLTRKVREVLDAP